MYSKISQSKQS